MNRNNCSANPWGVTANQVLRWYTRSMANAINFRSMAANERDPSWRKQCRNMMRVNSLNALYFRKFLPI